MILLTPKYLFINIRDLWIFLPLLPIALPLSFGMTVTTTVFSLISHEFQHFLSLQVLMYMQQTPLDYQSIRQYQSAFENDHGDV